MQEKPTLRDVAARAGVHVSTASRVLNPNNRERISAETRRRVLLAAEALDYRVSAVARALKTSRTFAVGVAVPDITNPVFPPVVRGLESVLEPAGFTLILANTDSGILRERTVVKAMVTRQVDGLVLLTSHLRDPIVEEMTSLGLPLVLVGRVVEEVDVSSVSADDVQGVGSAVDHLASLGHERIGYVGGPQSVSTGRNRYLGFLTGMRRAGLDVRPGLVAFAEAFDDLAGAKACHEILSWGEECSAFVAGSDAIALGCLDVLGEHGLDVPGDVSLVGYGGTKLAGHLRPPLTTVRVPYHEMGRAGAELLLEQIAGSSEPRQIVMDTHMAVGGSAAPPR